ncbi:MAG: hypothetical protein IJT91_03130 [Clostridia bacterium]|nr:hypothetical protein [Clostridia bacterium]
MKHFIDPAKFDADSLIGLIDLADRFKFERKNSIAHPHLRGKTLGVVCRHPSPVLKSALFTGMYELGGLAVDVPVDGIEDSRLAEAVRFSACSCSAVALCALRRSDVERIASGSDIPVVRCSDDTSAPIFVLSSLMTVRERTGALSGRKICCIDSDCRAYDGLIYAAISCGMRVSVAAPIGFRPNESIVDWGLHERRLEITSDPLRAAKGADAICTGIREYGAYPLTPGDYRVTEKLFDAANEGCAFFHAFPELRGAEISDGVYKDRKSDMLAESKNRLHIVKAVLTKTMKQ